MLFLTRFILASNGGAARLTLQYALPLVFFDAHGLYESKIKILEILGRLATYRVIAFPAFRCNNVNSDYIYPLWFI